MSLAWSQDTKPIYKKSVALLYTSNEQTGNELKERIPSVIPSKRIK